MIHVSREEKFLPEVENLQYLMKLAIYIVFIFDRKSTTGLILLIHKFHIILTLF